MALISNTKSSKKEKIKLELNAEVLANIRTYCEWAAIDDMAFFVEEAACFIFAKDKEFKAAQKALKKAAKAAKAEEATNA